MIAIIYKYNNVIKYASIDGSLINIKKELKLKEYTKIFTTSSYIYDKAIVIDSKILEIYNLNTSDIEMAYLTSLYYIVRRYYL